MTIYVLSWRYHDRSKQEAVKAFQKDWEAVAAKEFCEKISIDREWIIEDIPFKEDKEYLWEG